MICYSLVFHDFLGLHTQVLVW